MLIEPAKPADEARADHEFTIQLQEWLMREGPTYPAMPREGGQPNYFIINGRACPAGFRKGAICRFLTFPRLEGR